MKRRKQHRLGTIRSRTRPEEVIPEKGYRHRDSPGQRRTGIQTVSVLCGAIYVPWSLEREEQIQHPDTRGRRGKYVIVTASTYGVNTSFPAVKRMIPE